MHLAKVLAVALAATALAACHRTSDVPPQASASPSANLIGINPAEPTGDPPGTTPVASNTTVVTKEQESTAGPREGDSNSHSTVASSTPQKADGGNAQADRNSSNGSAS